MHDFQRTLVTLAAVAALGAWSAGPADATKPLADPSLLKADLPTMSQADCDKRFAAFDANHDGKLTYKEYADGRFGELRFAMAPSDEQIRGHKAQYTAAARRADANRDGWLTRREHLAACPGDG